MAGSEEYPAPGKAAEKLERLAAGLTLADLGLSQTGLNPRSEAWVS